MLERIRIRFFSIYVYSQNHSIFINFLFTSWGQNKKKWYHLEEQMSMLFYEKLFKFETYLLRGCGFSQPEATESIVVGGAVSVQWSCVWPTIIHQTHFITWEKQRELILFVFFWIFNQNHTDFAGPQGHRFPCMSNNCTLIIMYSKSWNEHKKDRILQCTFVWWQSFCNLSFKLFVYGSLASPSMSGVTPLHVAWG